MIRRLRCMKCFGLDFTVIARFYEDGRSMRRTGEPEYKCSVCGEKMELEWEPT